jgi:chemotaxis regulatin CheY-phosphate phosphatase CheZ
MIMRRVWKKTAKGEEEMRSRTYGLAPNVRRILILVDGVSDDRQILQKSAHLTDDVREGLRQLAQQEYIHEVVESLTIDNAKNELVRIAQETLGTAAEKVVEIVRQAPDDKDGLTAALKRCKKLVKMTIDEKKASVLDEQCSAVLAEIP